MVVAQVVLLVVLASVAFVVGAADLPASFVAGVVDRQQCVGCAAVVGSDQ